MPSDQRVDPERLAEIRERWERATPGPWCWEQVGEKSNDWIVGVAFAADDLDAERQLTGRIETSLDDDDSDQWLDRIGERYGIMGNVEGGYHDAEAIAAAPEDIAHLLATVDALLADNQRLRERRDELQARIDAACDDLAGITKPGDGRVRLPRRKRPKRSPYDAGATHTTEGPRE